ncbi:MAG: DMT family transporter [Candidatus Accumulibacter sp.]|jgi:drug/metabolite transporter (DMT)-like permease|nr:DMT family transporter [Accumulibacter sp.]
MFVRLAHPYLLLTLSSLFWSGNMVVGRAVRDDVPPFTLAFWRWAIAFALTLPFALPHVRSQWKLLKQNWRATALLGFIGVGCYNTFAYLALRYTAATNALLLNSVIPVATIVFSWIFLKKSLRRAEGFGVLISLTGVAVIVARGDMAALAALSLNAGDLWMLLAVLVWALYTIGLHWRPEGIHPMLLLSAFTLIGVITLLPASLMEIQSGLTLHPAPRSLFAILYVGVLPGFAGYVFYNRAVGEVGANRASLFIHLMPVFGTLLSAVFLGEIPGAYHYTGMALIFSGIYLTTSRPSS